MTALSALLQNVDCSWYTARRPTYFECIPSVARTLIERKANVRWVNSKVKRGFP